MNFIELVATQCCIAWHILTGEYVAGELTVFEDAFNALVAAVGRMAAGSRAVCIKNGFHVGVVSGGGAVATRSCFG